MTAIGRAVELTNRFFRCFSAPNICTSSQAVDDFAAIVNGALEAEGLLRFAGHASQCLACRDMLVTLIMATGLLMVGGDVAHYSYDAAGEVWSVVVLGLELGEIDSPGALDRRVVGPLRAAAADHSIQL